MVREYILPIAIIAVVASMLVPLPPFLLDILLVSNLFFALSLLILTLYISEPFKLSSLPSLLLLATLFRLALNISTTRLILATGEAGATVEAFGGFVIRGNIAVGLVIFLIITFVQFLVIAKGGERVAEVSARFSLDAMPGRQMSIDADLRSGLYDLETARRKRQELQNESRFYGALDGAMKFIKGDAVAGIVIVGVNIIGGFACGLLMEGMSIEMAFSRYTTLTIGDGLLSQIPSLLNSIAAGMIVTRVARGDEVPLATEMLSQLGQLKRVHAICGVVALLASFCPGMPSVPFSILGLFLLLSAIWGSQSAEKEPRKTAKHFRPKVPSLLRLELDNEAMRRLPGAFQIEALFEDFRKSVFNTHGLLLMPPEISESRRNGSNISLLLRGIPVETLEIKEADDFSMRLNRFLQDFVARHCEELIDDISTRRLLDYFDADFPELISSVIPNIASVTKLSSLLRKLAEEGVSFRNFDIVLQAIAEGATKAGSDRALLEDIRVALRRVICAKYLDTEKKIHAYTLDPLIDMSFARAEGERAPIDFCNVSLIVNSLGASKENENRLIVVSKKARLLVRECLMMQGFKVNVLAYEELAPGVELEVIGIIKHEDIKKREGILEALAA